MPKNNVRRLLSENITPYIVACLLGVPNSAAVDGFVRKQWSQIPNELSSQLQSAQLKLAPLSKGFHCEGRFLHEKRGIVRVSGDGGTPEIAVQEMFRTLDERVGLKTEKSKPLFARISGLFSV